jgi:hypothetical protein
MVKEQSDNAIVHVAVFIPYVFGTVKKVCFFDKNILLYIVGSRIIKSIKTLKRRLKNSGDIPKQRLYRNNNTERDHVLAKPTR